MPYVPSKKTDGKSDDRERIDKVVDELAQHICKQIKTNRDIAEEYVKSFITIGEKLLSYELDRGVETDPCDEIRLAYTIYDVAKKYQYQGAFLGELNYAITRLIQEVPKQLVECGKQEKELRYFIYAYTVEALTRVSKVFHEKPIFGIGGVFEDIKDEYKRRVNTAYEAAQIVKSGDCYDTPYRTRLVEVKDFKTGKRIGFQEVMVDSKSDLCNDVNCVLGTKTMSIEVNLGTIL